VFELDRVSWSGRLTEVSLQWLPGQRVALIGPNGAGKSSLLQVLAGQQVPDRGQIRLNGRPLSAYSAMAQARWRAWLPQAGDTVAPLTGEQLLHLGQMPDVAVAPERLAEVVETLELAALLPRPLMQLSGGERQRLHLGRVLVQVWAQPRDHPRALLLDEALASLDIRHRMRLLAALARWCACGELALVWSSHDLNEAFAHSTRVWLMQAGRLIAAGETAQVMTEKSLSQVFQWPIERVETPKGPVLRAKHA